MDVSRLKLRETAHLRWGDDVSPHFDAFLGRLERAIEALPEEPDASVGTWPPEPLSPPTAPVFPVPPMPAGGDLTEAGAATLAEAIRNGSVSSLEVVDALLARAERLDPLLHVWAHLDPERARDEARWRDERRGGRGGMGSLERVPLGVKDIILVDAMPMQANSRVPARIVVHEDALAIARLRNEGGALILGKTATTEYAYADPSEARNPWNPAHTPGGSSSGSAAGVAARMMPAALGTQTAGSILRPAAYCGVVGFKPTTERIDRLDVTPLARSLDHVGTFTRSVADAALLYRVMAQADGVPCEARPPRLALWPALLHEHTDEVSRETLQAAGRRLEAAGAEVDLVTSEADFVHMQGFFARALAVHAVIMAAEVAAYHLDAHADQIAELGSRLRAMVESGGLVPAQALLKAQSERWRLWDLWHTHGKARHYDAVIVPAAPGTAPPGLDSTGDPSLNAPWSLLGVPAISIPITVAENGLPLGMQLVAPYGEDARLLAVAHWCEQAIGFDAKPPLP